MKIREELRRAFRKAEEIAEGLEGEVEIRLLTIEDDEDKPWAEVKVCFIDGEADSIKVRTGSTVVRKDWTSEEEGLESIENVVSEIENMLIVNLIWLGEWNSEI